MALCLILMFGRLGSVAGSNLVGALIASHCNLIFFVYTGLILSMLTLEIYNITNINII